MQTQAQPAKNDTGAEEGTEKLETTDEQVEQSSQESNDDTSGEENSESSNDKGDSLLWDKEEVAYELKAAEDSPVTDEDLAAIAEFAKANAISKEAAQKLVEDREKAIAAYQARQLEAHEALSKSWVTEIRRDKEVGGVNLGKNTVLVRRLVEQYGPEGFKDSLNQTRLGNHPLLFKFLSRLAKDVYSDDDIIDGESAASKKEKTLEEIFYPDS